MYSMHDGANISVHQEIAERLQPKSCIEIGTYYGGITYKLSKLLPNSHFFAVQSYHDHKLNHMPNTDRGEYSIGKAELSKSKGLDEDLKDQDWKRSVKRHFPEEYHNYFDFNLLVKTFQDCDNVTLILDTSPFKYDWNNGFDLVIFDVSPLYAENKIQFDYWAKYGNPNSYILMGAYNHQQEFYEYVTSKKYTAEKIRDDYVLVRL
jgi:hypothetical protein|tara:strand:+ start:3962 stop:4579 length:618 start_codon:yes stop_codon:yes gene_type:complete